LVAVHFGKIDQAKYLASTFGLRINSRIEEITVRLGDFNLSFSNWLLPLLVKNKSHELLAAFVKRDDFVLQLKDLNSLVMYAIYEKQYLFVKTLFNSEAAQFLFTSIDYDEQKEFVKFVLEQIRSFDNNKTVRLFESGLIEDCLAKRPYARILALVLLEGSQPSQLDSAKVARECLKNLIGEDFLHLYQAGVMEPYEKKYRNTQGNRYENEMAKIVERYLNEGKMDLSSAN
jgi:hypothetical protein